MKCNTQDCNGIATNLHNHKWICYYCFREEIRNIPNPALRITEKEKEKLKNEML